MSYRIPAVAGSFYPDNARDLTSLLKQMMAHADEVEKATTGKELNEASIRDRPKMLVVPHAGYRYSGDVAAMAYQKLVPWAGAFSRVVLLGPSHRVALRGMALVDTREWQGFETPLGVIELDNDEVEQLADSPAIHSVLKIDNQPHYFEHSLEVQLPFLQMILRQFKILPIVVGECDAHDVAAILEKYYQDQETLIIVSSDLSHYHDYVSAQEIDAKTNEKILHLEADIVGEQACGCYPLNGLLMLAKEKGLAIENLALLNSADHLIGQQDSQSDRSQVVGYGAYVIH
jgi:AmmeMemoRadiSam system protein B